MKRGYNMDIRSTAVLAAQELDWGLIGSTVVTGLVVVFLILAILVLFLWLFGKVFKGIGNMQDKKAKKEAEKKSAAVKAADAKKPAASPSVPAQSASDYDDYEEEDDDEIIAVIAAAIAAYGEAEGKQYRIASIKRPRTARSGWSAAGIADNMRGFLN